MSMPNTGRALRSAMCPPALVALSSATPRPCVAASSDICVPPVLDEVRGYRFEFGKVKLLREGADMLTILSGSMTMRALEVAEPLRVDKIDVAVLHSPTIKPRDEAAILDAVRYKDRLVVVAENHSVIGRLGEAVASALLRNRVQPAAFQLAGLPDAFLDAGADRNGIEGTNWRAPSLVPSDRWCLEAGGSFVAGWRNLRMSVMGRYGEFKP